MMNIQKTPSLILIVCLIGLPQLSETIYSPALPAIAKSLMTSTALVEWTLSVYFCGFALGVLFWGRLSDKIGRRKAMLSGLLVYVVGCTLCLLCHSITTLLLARVLQAFGIGVGSVVTMAIMREAYPATLRPQIFAIIGMALAISPALGPVIGGYLSHWLSWRANFAFLTSLGIALFFITFFYLPETGQATSDNSVRMWTVFKRMLSDKRVLACIWMVGASNGLLFSYYAEAPFIFIDQLGLSSAHFGWLGFFVACASLLGARASKNKSGTRTSPEIIAEGMKISLISAFCLCAVVMSGLVSHSPLIIAIPLLMLPIASIIYGTFGYIVPATLSYALVEYQSVLGTAGALLGLSYYLLIAGFTALMGMLHNGTLLPMPLYFLSLCLSLYISYNLGVGLESR